MNNRKRSKEKIYKYLITLAITIVLGIVGYYCPELKQVIEQTQGSTGNIQIEQNVNLKNDTTLAESISTDNLKDIPEYKDSPYVYVNNNVPSFLESDYTTEPFEKYSELDSLGRCGVAYANVCKELMPAEGEKRGDISSVKPSGWKQKKYNGEFLYNRCHLIGYQLAAENANEKNLITGTRYFNVTGMLDFENRVAEYINNQGKNENKHVLYRVTPYFEGDNLLATGVEMEAYSVEDNGSGVSFNVFVYNVQPGITLDYRTGQSSQK